MRVLKFGSSGGLVKTLQQALKDRGFDPGIVDGDFGDGTDKAVRAFQDSAGLAADGEAGKDTWDALGLPAPAVPPPGPDIANQVTTAMMHQMFPGTPVSHIAANLPVVLKELSAAGLGDKTMVLMALGTIRAETATFEPIPEGISRFNTEPGGEPFGKYNNRDDLGNGDSPDGASFKGRGFVQLTGRANYTEFGPKLTPPVDLVADPDKACDPVIAARLLALFLKDKEDRIREAMAADDLADARKAVNGGSHGLDDFTSAVTIGQRVIPAA